MKSFVIDTKDFTAENLEFLQEVGVPAFVWNANFDDLVLRSFGLNVPMEDSMLSASLLRAGTTEEMKFISLAKAAARELGEKMEGKGTTQLSFDSTSPLTEEQVLYAAQDAEITLRLGRIYQSKLQRFGLSEVNRIEQKARPAIAGMSQAGLPFNVEGYHTFLESVLEKVNSSIKQMADAVDMDFHGYSGEGKAQPRLIDGEKSYLLTSTPGLKVLLNECFPDLVISTYGDELSNEALDNSAQRTLLNRAEELVEDFPEMGDAVKFLKGLLEFKKYSKIHSTYGDSFLKNIKDTGRFYSTYLQGLTGTGRLASQNPNAQNLSPVLKSYVTPRQEERTRVFIQGDFSQAELRVLAYLAKDEAMIASFKQGDDFHAVTAGRMFGLDMKKLKEEDPEKYSSFRKKAKAVNFGTPYGVGAKALATRLSNETKTEVSEEDVKAFLASYAAAYPQVAEWLQGRDADVEEIAHTATSNVSWRKSLRMLEVFDRAGSFYKKLGLSLTDEEIAKEVLLAEGVIQTPELDAELVTAKKALTKVRSARTRAEKAGKSLEDFTLAVCQAEAKVIEIEERIKETHLSLLDPELVSNLAKDFSWVFKLDSPVALREDGSPVFFESRTLTGRRRLYFQPMYSGKYSGILVHAITQICMDHSFEEFVQNFSTTHGMKGIPKAPPQKISWDKKRSLKNAIIKAFEGDKGKARKAAFILEFTAKYPEQAVSFLDKALMMQVRGSKNEYRNMPIQGLVADIALEADAEIPSLLERFPGSEMVQAVHDSKVIECYENQAEELGVLLKEVMESAMHKRVPGVPAVVDIVIMSSLDSKDEVSFDAVDDDDTDEKE